VRKKERSPVRGHNLEKLSFSSLEEENRSDLSINIPIPDKANLSQGILDGVPIETDHYLANRSQKEINL